MSENRIIRQGGTVQPFNQETFATYLRERRLTAEGHIPFYVKWVQRFLAAELPLVATSPKDKLQAFENLLAKNPAIQEWQVRQAVRAVDLYLKVFAPATDTVPAKPVDHEQAVSAAETVYAQMRDLIRVRHYSYRTEQTYLDWVRRYVTCALGLELDKYPAAPKEFGWQYLFPAGDLAVDPRSGVVRRHHISDQVPQRIMRDAVRKAGIDKPASIHCMRHSFATHMLLKGVNIREVQKYLGHESVETTMIYTHVIRGMDSTAESPLDEL